MSGTRIDNAASKRPFLPIPLITVTPPPAQQVSSVPRATPKTAYAQDYMDTIFNQSAAVFEATSSNEAESHPDQDPTPTPQPVVPSISKATSAASLLGLPSELRQEILRYVLPIEKTIHYKCPHRVEYQVRSSAVACSMCDKTASSAATLIDDTLRQQMSEARHVHRRCGLGPGWSCYEDQVHVSLGVMSACRVLYWDYIELLYKRAFEVQVTSDGCFLVEWGYNPCYDYVSQNEDGSRYRIWSTAQAANADPQLFESFPFCWVTNLILSIEELPMETNGRRKRILRSLSWIANLLLRQGDLPKKLTLTVCYEESGLGVTDMEQEWFRRIIKIVAPLMERTKIESKCWSVELRPASLFGDMDYRAILAENSKGLCPRHMAEDLGS